MRILFTLLLATAACGTDIRSDTGMGSDQPLDGEQLFADNCSTCHGIDAAGTDKAPQIQSPVVGYATYVVRHGRNEMGYPAPMDPFQVADLSDPELTAILAWLDSVPKPTTGKDLYVRFCQNCHGANAHSGRVLKDIRGELGELASKVRFGSGGISYGARYNYMPAWNTAAISDSDVGLLSAYIGTL